MKQKVKQLLKKIIHPFYKRYHFWYHKKSRKYSYKNVYTIVQPTVFSPIHTISTKVFLDYISTLNLKNKSILELGCGSGIISVFCASKRAKVTASDINEIAVNSIEKVAIEQGFKIHALLSDLFENIENRSFNYIFINPPYYPKKPKNLEEQAWFCGKDFDYFKKLFSQLEIYIDNDTNTLMILSNTCDIKTIKKISSSYNMELKLLYTKKTTLEVNYIYRIIGI